MSAEASSDFYPASQNVFTLPMIRSLYQRSTLVLLVGPRTACGGDTIADSMTPCTSDVTVPATANPVRLPPRLGVGTLWNISSSEGQIRSGVRYGKVPAGATEVTPVQPLQSGWFVTVNVFALNNTVGGQAQVQIP